MRVRPMYARETTLTLDQAPYSVPTDAGMQIMGIVFLPGR